MERRDQFVVDSCVGLVVDPHTESLRVGVVRGEGDSHHVLPAGRDHSLTCAGPGLLFNVQW